MFLLSVMYLIANIVQKNKKKSWCHCTIQEDDDTGQCYEVLTSLLTMREKYLGGK